MLDPHSINSIRFSTTRLREGYDQDEVDDYLDKVVAELETLQRQLAEAEETNRSLRTRNERLSSFPTSAMKPVPIVDSASPAGSVEKILVLAQETADKHVADSKAEGDRLVREAAQTAAKAIEDGLATAKRVTDDAALEASRIRSEGLADKQKALEELLARHGQVSGALDSIQVAGAKVRHSLNEALSAYDKGMTQ